jgi:uncharacterized protein (TIGR03083 family)
VSVERTMAIVSIDLEQARSALAGAAFRTAALLRSSAQPALRIPKLDWSVRDVAVHLSSAARGFAAAAAGEGFEGPLPDLPTTQARVAYLNTRTIEEADETDLEVLARQLEDGVAAFLATTAGRPGLTPIPTPWYGPGTVLDLDAATCVLLGEHLVHGYDVATATGRPWPLDSRQAALVLAGLTSMMPLYVDRERGADLCATYDFQVRGGVRFTMSFDRGALSVEPPGRRADCHVSADPVSCMLVVYGRRSQGSAVLRGQMVAWGRKPWLGLKLVGLFLKP